MLVALFKTILVFGRGGFVNVIWQMPRVSPGSPPPPGMTAVKCIRWGYCIIIPTPSSRVLLSSLGDVIALKETVESNCYLRRKKEQEILS